MSYYNVMSYMNESNCDPLSYQDFSRGKQNAMELPGSQEKPDPSTSMQIVEMTSEPSTTFVAQNPASPPTYQEQLNQGLPLSQQQVAMGNSRQSPTAMARAGGVVRTEVTQSHGVRKKNPKKKKGEMKFRFDQNGHLIRSGFAASFPDSMVKELEENYRRQQAEGEGKATSSGIQYIELVETLERFRDKNMRDQDVGTLRRLATRYRKVVYLTPQDLEGKDKIKFLWSNPPDNWPAALIHVDPNNPGKDAMGKALQKPKKEELVPVLEYFKHLYEERRPTILQYYTELKTGAACMSSVKQEPASPAQPTAMEQDYVPASPVVEVPKNDVDLFNAVLGHCVEPERAKALLEKPYNKFWNTTVSSSDAQALLERMQRMVRNFLEQVLTKAVQGQVQVGFEDLLEPLKAIYAEYLQEEEMRKNQPPMQMTINNVPAPVSDMAPGQGHQQQNINYVANVTMINTVPMGSVSSQESRGSTINELQLHQMGLGGGSEVLVENQSIIALPADTTAIKQAPQMQLVLTDHDYYQRPPEAVVQDVANGQVACVTEVNDPELERQIAEAQELMRQTQPAILQELQMLSPTASHGEQAVETNYFRIDPVCPNLPHFIFQDEDEGMDMA